MDKHLRYFCTTWVSTILFVFVSCNNGSNIKKSTTDSSSSASARTVHIHDTIAELKTLGFNTVNAKTTIAPGGTFIIKSTTIIFPYLEMGDNAKLIVDPSLGKCEIVIWEGVFGSNTDIVADGANGKNASSNPQDPWILTHGWWQADANHDGSQGIAGLNGENGGHGLNLTLKIGFNSVKTLSIHANGGHGGNGSNGGTGEYGGRRTGVFGGHHGAGGQGGKGGNAGNGGNGGPIAFEYWLNNNTIPDPSTPQYISVNSAPGNHGSPGAGGAGGAHDGGGAAGPGPTGSSGTDGQRGDTKTPTKIPKPPTIFGMKPSSN